MTLIELSGLVSVIGAAIAAFLADGHSGVLSRVAAFFGGGIFGLAVYLCVLGLTAGSLARTRPPESSQSEGSRLQRTLAVGVLLSIPMTPVIAIVASDALTRELLALWN